MDDYDERDLAYLAAWRRCCQEIPDHTARLLRHGHEFVAMINGGDPRATARFFDGLWPDDDWSWPWLEEWRQAFTSACIREPRSWSKAYDPYRSIKVVQFGGTAVRRAYEEREWRQTVSMLSARGAWQPGMPFPIRTSSFAGWRIIPGDGDPAAVVRACFKRFLAGEHDCRPPYFPLDGSRIELFTRRQAERRNG